MQQRHYKSLIHGPITHTYGQFYLRREIMVFDDDSQLEFPAYQLTFSREDAAHLPATIEPVKGIFSPEERLIGRIPIRNLDIVSIVMQIRSWLRQDEAAIASQAERREQLRDMDEVAKLQAELEAGEPDEFEQERGFRMTVAEYIENVETTLKNMRQRHEDAAQALETLETEHQDELRELPAREQAQREMQQCMNIPYIEKLKNNASWWLQPEGEWWMRKFVPGEATISYGPFKVYHVPHRPDSDQENNPEYQFGRRLMEHLGRAPAERYVVRFEQDEGVFWLTWPWIGGIGISEYSWPTIKQTAQTWMNWVRGSIRRAQEALEKSDDAEFSAYLRAGIEQRKARCQLVEQALQENERTFSADGTFGT